MKSFNFDSMIWFMLAVLTFSCGEDDAQPNACAEDATPVFQEEDSILLIEIEQVDIGAGWQLVNDLSNATGQGYVKWEGNDEFNNPGKGVISFKLHITHPGTYRFIWRSAVTEGSDPTESNDSWLRFSDADDFYGEKSDGSIVYPKGTGKTPNPQGASSEGWFKVYRSGNPLDFKWQSRTSDHDAHDIFVLFDSPGIYTMEVSGRSRGHAIDKFVLYQEQAYTQNEATSRTTPSVIGCQ